MGRVAATKPPLHELSKHLKAALVLSDRVKLPILNEQHCIKDSIQSRKIVRNQIRGKLCDEKYIQM